MDQADLSKWCIRELHRLFSVNIENDIISYLVSIDTESAITEYINGIFHQLGDYKKRKNDCNSFIREYIVRWRSLRNEQDIVKPLKRLTDDELVLFADKRQTKNNKKKTKPVPPPGFDKPVANKSKYTPLMSAKGQDMLVMNIPGRHVCQCLGQKHDLINNCLDCGRIICTQEGAGPCLFCGNIVYTKEDEQILSRDSKRAEKLKEKMRQQYDIKDGTRPHVIDRNQSNNDLIEANEHKDRLIQYDQTSQRRTKVVDDESDYFKVDSQWISDEERLALQKRDDTLRDTKYGRSKGIKVTLDITGKGITEQKDSNIDLYNMDEENDMIVKGSQNINGGYELAQRGLHDHSISLPPPIYLGKKCKQNKKKESILTNPIIRIQDRNILEMRDEGKCLSMHQPWASLLVYGIKKFEGRSWYSSHRGKLWIASTAKPVDQNDIIAMKQFYKTGDIYPDCYPSGCILGCVDVIDCLSQQECIEKYNNCDSDCDYVFVCDNPQLLLIKYPIKGKHKIWRLDTDIHAAIKNGLTQTLIQDHHHIMIKQ